MEEAHKQLIMLLITFWVWQMLAMILTV